MRASKKRLLYAARQLTLLHPNLKKTQPASVIQRNNHLVLCAASLWLIAIPISFAISYKVTLNSLPKSPTFDLPKFRRYINGLKLAIQSNIQRLITTRIYSLEHILTLVNHVLLRIGSLQVMSLVYSNTVAGYGLGGTAVLNFSGNRNRAVARSNRKSEHSASIATRRFSALYSQHDEKSVETPSTLTSAIGLSVTKARLKLGISRKELAAYLGISVVTLVEIENGFSDREIAIAILEKIKTIQSQ